MMQCLVLAFFLSCASRQESHKHMDDEADLEAEIQHELEEEELLDIERKKELKQQRMLEVRHVPFSFLPRRS